MNSELKMRSLTTCCMMCWVSTVISWGLGTLAAWGGRLGWGRDSEESGDEKKVRKQVARYQEAEAKE